MNTEFSKAIHRNDAYRMFRFLLKWDDIYVAGFSHISPLIRPTQVVAHRAGYNPAAARRLPGQNEYSTITLTRGVTYDVTFQRWAKQSWDYRNPTINSQQGAGGNQIVSLTDFRKDLIIELYNAAGQKVISYNIYQAWPTDFVVMPTLGANADAVAFETFRLAVEGWERDPAATEPDEPSFLLPLG